MKNSILGIIKALEQQKKALVLNIYIYIGLTLPLAFFLVFKIQKYGILMDTCEYTNNRGVAVWIAFVIGSGLQTIGYLIIVSKSDWH